MRAHTFVPESTAGLCVLAALAAAGCGGSSDTVDATKVEQGIKDSLSTTSTKVTKASCPNDVKSKDGATFTCSVTFSNGATGKAKVTQTGTGHDYTYALKPGSVQVPGSTADAAVEKSLAGQGAPNATVKCPQNIIVKVGTTVSCDVSGASGKASGQVTFTFSGAEGTVDPASVKTS
ncbi:MAG: DUF4333 domain-containing protein [Chloroflexota bacterium]